MSEPCKCRDFTCSGNRGFAVMAITGHHPECPTHRPKPMDDETIIGHLLMILDKVRAESEQRRQRCNRMTATAKLEDVTWRPK